MSREEVTDLKDRNFSYNSDDEVTPKTFSFKGSDFMLKQYILDIRDTVDELIVIKKTLMNTIYASELLMLFN